ncbi:hypothetical protein EB001_25220, partial [bacterium]|nr:hypothetical protein [bacterium]
KGSQRNGGQVSKKLRAYKKNKAGEMISIVGFGRPKFGGKPAEKSTATENTNKAVKPKPTKVKTCPTCGQEVKK